MEYARAAMPIYGLQRALLDGLSMVRCVQGSNEPGPPPLGFKIKPENSVWALQKFGMRGCWVAISSSEPSPFVLTRVARRLS